MKEQIHIRGKENRVDYRGILDEVLQEERLQSDLDLAKALAKYSEAYYAPSEVVSHSKNLEVIFDETRRIRIYVIDQLFGWLYRQNKPESLIEIGSAGDITAAMTLPRTQITSLDIDPDIFLNVPSNTLPRKVFERLDVNKKMEGYGGDDRNKRRKLALVEKCLPNWKKCIADGTDIPFPNNSYDVALVQGPLEAGDFLTEMARVIKPGGLIVTILQEDYKEIGCSSVYATRKYNSYPDVPMIDVQKAQSLGLQKVDIPFRFRGYENLAVWMEDSRPKGAGIVFQVFRKVTQK
ncbi:methyltransferase domain-containing protein [Candidatus Roizmanbacteria bacterium]|nr:methyltransferase domain-containing protein [Candidatus Roizmanbacteria bacterium]